MKITYSALQEPSCCSTCPSTASPTQETPDNQALLQQTLPVSKKHETTPKPSKAPNQKHEGHKGAGAAAAAAGSRQPLGGGSVPTPAARRRRGSSLRGQPGPGERSRLTSSRHREPPDHHHHRQPPPPPSYLAVLSPRPGLRRCPRPQHRLAGSRPSSRRPPLRPRPPLRLTAPGGACPPPRLPSAGRARHPAAAGGKEGGTPAQRPPPGAL